MARFTPSEYVRKTRQMSPALVQALAFSPRIRDVLEFEFHITTIASFINFDCQKLLSFQGVGRKKIQAVEDVQRQYRAESLADTVSETNYPVIQDNTWKTELSAWQLKILANFAHVQTLHDFLASNLTSLWGVNGIGAKRLKLLIGLQEKLRRTLDIAVPQFKNALLNVRMGTLQDKHQLSFIRLADATMATLRVKLGIPKDEELNDFIGVSTIGQFARQVGWDYPFLYQVFSEIILSNANLSADISFYVESPNGFSSIVKAMPLSQPLIHLGEKAQLERLGITNIQDYLSFISVKHHPAPDVIIFACINEKLQQRLVRFQKIFNEISGADGPVKLLNTPTASRLKVFESRIIRQLTLEEVGRELGVTRERVRQIETYFFRCLYVEHNSQSDLPLLPSTVFDCCLRKVVDTELERGGSVVSADTIAKQILKEFNWSESYKNFVTWVLRNTLSPGMIVDEIDGMLLVQDPTKRYATTCLHCVPLANKLRSEVDHAGKLSSDDVKKITTEFCAPCKNRLYNLIGWERWLPCFLAINHLVRMGKHIDVGGTLTTKESARDFFAHLLKLRGPREFALSEIDKMIESYPLDVSSATIRNYVGELCAPTGRGRYLFKCFFPKLPVGLVQQITRHIRNELKTDPTSYYSTAGALRAFGVPLMKYGIDTPQKLFAVLKLDSHVKELNFIKCPYVTTVENTAPFKLLKVLESYIAEKERVPEKELINYFCQGRGFTRSAITMALPRSDMFVLSDNRELISIDSLGVSVGDLTRLHELINEALGDVKLIDLRQFFNEHKVTCLSLKITGPLMLGSVLEHFFGDEFAFKGTGIARLPEDLVSISTMIYDFVMRQNSYCTLEDIQTFLKGNGFNDPFVIRIIRGTLCKYSSVHFVDKDGNGYPIYRYAQDTWVPSRALGDYATFEPAIVSCAKEALSHSDSPGHCYDYIWNILNSNKLPSLPNESNLSWTSSLIQGILEASNDFIIYGKNRMVYSSRTNSEAICCLGDLCALLLAKEFNGAANLKEFSRYLQQKKIIADGASLNASLIAGSSRVVINGKEVYTAEVANVNKH